MLLSIRNAAGARRTALLGPKRASLRIDVAATGRYVITKLTEQLPPSRTQLSSLSHQDVSCYIISSLAHSPASYLSLYRPCAILREDGQ